MKITKYGHCCMLIEENGLRILTDPGTYSEQQNSILNIDIVLITHEHPDHFHIDSLKQIISNNPNTKIITNTAVANLLKVEGIDCQILEHRGSTTENGLLLEAFGEKHAIMYPSIEPVQNTGYLIASKLFYPGDAFVIPGKPVDILALPVAGPWMKISEAIDYAIEVKPNICFPVHDGILKTPGMVHRMPAMLLEPQGIKFVVLDIDQPQEL